MEERYLRHDLGERVVRWVMALSVIFLVISGLNIRFPGLVIFDEMTPARFVHFISMYFLIFSLLFHVYHSLATGLRKVPPGDVPWQVLKEVGAQMTGPFGEGGVETDPALNSS